VTAEQWARVQQLWEGVIDLPAADRARWLDGACAGDPGLRSLVDALLSADAAGDGPLRSAVTAAVAEAASVREPRLHHRIGSYRLLSELGSGGMGTVYLAERDDDEFHQQVAVKLARGLLDEERVRRFRAERQILASLAHPNIARLLDGGTTDDGYPYIVMEYVEGDTIDRYVSKRALDSDATLRLFLDVAAAVSHAHRSLVVHRDLKPNNILVGPDGVPKLLDFGIAKLLGDDAAGSPALTRTAIRILTPEYAAPETCTGSACCCTSCSRARGRSRAGP
jgi:serine/threonine protein kinase